MRQARKAATKQARADTLCNGIEASGVVVCEVIAPSLIPRKPGERIKTDRRDAPVAKTARGSRTVSSSLDQDARARGHVFNVTRRLWSGAHSTWLTAMVFDNEVDRVVVTEYKLAVEQAECRFAGDGH